jgi:hypothetical protein
MFEQRAETACEQRASVVRPWLAIFLYAMFLFSYVIYFYMQCSYFSYALYC